MLERLRPLVFSSLRSRGQLSLSLFVEWPFLHSEDIVHGDLHMGNILVQFPESIDRYSTSELYEKFGEPESEAVVRIDNMPLSNGIPAHVFIPVGSAFAAMILPLERKGLSSAISVNLSTLTKRLGFLRRLFLSFSHARPDSPMSHSPLPRMFGHLPVLFGRFLASDLCLTLFAQLLIVCPRSKSKFLAYYLTSGGKIGIEDWNGLMKKES